MPKKSTQQSYQMLNTRRNINFFRASANDIAISRANYIRSLDLVLAFLSNADNFKDLFGENNPWVILLYKVVSRAILPFTKLIKSLNTSDDLTKSKNTTSIKTSHNYICVLNGLDLVLSGLSLIPGLIYTFGGGNDVYARHFEMGMVAAAMILHIIKDHLENQLTEKCEDNFIQTVSKNFSA